MKKGINQDRKALLEQRQSITPQICPGCTHMTPDKEQQRVAQWKTVFGPQTKGRASLPSSATTNINSKLETMKLACKSWALGIYMES